MVTEYLTSRFQSSAASPFASVSAQLVDLGYFPLPIDPHGKRPAAYAGPDRIIGLRGWQSFPDSDAAWRADMWSRMPGAFGVGVRHTADFGCIDYDHSDPELSAKLLAYLAALPGSPVARIGRKGWARYFRLEGVHSAAINAPDGARVVDILAAGRQSVIPPSVHPDTGKAYVWLTDDTLLDTPPEALPLLTSADIDKLLAIIADHFGVQPDQIAVAKPANSSRLGDALGDMALANLAAWVPALGLARCRPKHGGFEAVATWRASGTGRDTAKRKRNLSITSQGIRDFGDDKGYSPVSLVAAVLGISPHGAWNWLADRVGYKPEPWQPRSKTATDGHREAVAFPPRIPLDEASDALQIASAEFFSDGIPAATEARTLRSIALHDASEHCELAASANSFKERMGYLWEWQQAYERAESHERPPVQVFKVEPGAGKTAAVIADIARQFRHIGIAVPEHALAEEVRADLAKAFAAAGVEADVAVWEGIDRPGQCHRTKDRMAVQKVGLSVESTLCGQWLTNKDGGRFWKPLCPHAQGGTGAPCGRTLQKAKRPQVWIVSHASLFTERKALFAGGEPEALIVDESILKSAMPSDETEGDWRDFADMMALTPPQTVLEGRLASFGCGVPDYVEWLWRALSEDLSNGLNNEPDPMARHGLLKEAAAMIPVHDFEGGPDYESVIAYHEQQWELRKSIALGESGSELQAGLQDTASLSDHKWRIAFLKEIVTLIEREGATESGRIVTRRSGNAMEFSHTQMRQVHATWQTGAVLHLDATAAPATLLEPVFGRKVELVQDIAVEWPDEIEVTVVQGAPISRSKLIKTNNGKSEPTKNFRHLENHVALMSSAALASGKYHGNRVLYVPRKAVADLMDAARADAAGLDIESSGKMVGRNEWKDAAGVIITASADPGPRAFERAAGVLTGEMPARLALPEMDGSKRDAYRWPTWQQQPLSQETRTGELFTTLAPDHPDQTVLELYEHVVIGAIVQIAARVRPVRREGKPCFIAVVCDHPVPFHVARVEQWSAVEIGEAAEMLMANGIFTDPAAMRAAYPAKWTTQDSARNWISGMLPRVEARVPFWGHFASVSNIELPIGFECKMSPERGFDPERLSYRRTGDSRSHDFLYPSWATYAADPLAHIERVLGHKVEAVTDNGVLFTTAAHVLAADPSAYPSHDAAKKALQRNPVTCPEGWQTFTLRLAGKGQTPSPIYVHPDNVATAQELIASLIGDRGSIATLV